jgi:O-acetyl-ADP-ribose deacetylase
MRVSVSNTILELMQGDITRQATDAIVNAANSSLLGGGGVDGAIHRAAGPELLEETRTLGGCETGSAKITGGYRLPAKYIIHAVGPVYRPNDPTVARLLASAYRRSLEIATEHQLRSIAFPAISTGIYGYPMSEAASITLKTIIDYLGQADTTITLVRQVLFDAEALSQFQQALNALMRSYGEVQPA